MRGNLLVIYVGVVQFGAHRVLAAVGVDGETSILNRWVS